MPDSIKSKSLFFKLGLGGWIGNPNNWLSWISLDDTIGAIHFILENSDRLIKQNLPVEKSNSEKNTSELFKAINLTAPNPATAREFAKALAKALKRPALFRIPKLMPKLLMGKELINAILQSARVVPKELLDAGYEFKHPDIYPAFKEML